ncbi:MAG: hypothetical protein G3W58_22345 [Pantoea ananatis]|nr:hypothetical protein [Pantoea ananatis]
MKIKIFSPLTGFPSPPTACQKSLGLLFGLLILSGCATTHHQPTAQQDSRAGTTTLHRSTGMMQGDKIESTTAAETPHPQAATLKRCERELDALKSVNPEDYRRRVAVFSQLMTAASQYGSVRNAADTNTTAAVDALYQYRVSRVCAGISLALLNALSERGEGHK